MQRRQTLLAVFIGCAFLPLTEVRADDVWQGSYAVDNECFCIGDISDSLATRIVPSPIGGQTVLQVCAKVGKGPGLTVRNGVFNHTVYKDPQCGNGPFASAKGPRDIDCLGTVDGTYGSCQPAGPRWALDRAYNSIASTESKDPVTLADAPVVAKAPSLAAAEPIEATQSNSVSVDESTSGVAASELKTISPTSVLENFTGKIVTIEGVRYLQARDGLPAQGGVTGSRIILDGLLYLREDEHLNVADLYGLDASPELAAAKATTEPIKSKKVEATKTLKAKANEKSATNQRQTATQSNAQALAQEREKQEKIRREAQARADFLEKQKLRDARLAAQRARVLNDKRAEVEAEVEAQPEVVSTESDDGVKSIVITDSQALEEASTQVAAQDPETESVEATPMVLNALRLPIGARASSRNFAYVEAMPANYDIGGGGLVLEGSAHSNERIQYVGKLGVSDTYQEVMIGGSYYFTPAMATRMTVVLLAGIEFGSFELRDEVRAPGLSVTSTDNGLFLGASSRVVINNKFELKGGLGYSSFFEGDITLFGGGYYHVTRNLDVMSRFELGDNDLLGIGVRYYY